MRYHHAKVYFSFFFIFFVFGFLNGQPWLSDPDKKDINFFEIQKQFNAYWKDKEVPRSSGYKPFKRWEWYWENRVLPDGSFPKAGFVKDEFEKYVQKHQVKNNGQRTVYPWLSLGPSTDNGGYAGHGRINSIGFHPTDNNKIYVGTAGGGFWISEDGGNTWMTTTDDLGALGVSGIAVDPVNPLNIYIATGDGDAADNYSIGVYKSTDGGLTFAPTGLNWSSSGGNVIRRIIFDPSNANTLFVATNSGIYKTTDAGTTWNLKQSGNFFDIEANPNSVSNTFFASKSNSILRSTNNGENWSTDYTISGSNRVSIAVTPADTNYIYAVSSKSINNSFNGLYRSTNGGQNFTLRSSIPNILGWTPTGTGIDTSGQGWYDLTIVADPSNVNTIYVGAINTWKSTNGGSTWILKSHWSGASGVQTVHADKHVLEFRGTNLWEGNDGGVYKSANGGTSWVSKTNGIVHSQMYRLGVSQSDGKVITGLQDNGTKLLNTSGWTDIYGGDGMECIIHENNNRINFRSIYLGEIYRTTNDGASLGSINDHITETVSGAWVTPYILDPSNNNIAFIGFNNVFRSLDRGDNWTKLSNFSIGTLTYLAVAPSNPSVIVTGNAGNMRRTINSGTNWTTITLPSTNVTSVFIDYSNADILYATMSNYSAGNKVFKSVNGGASWTNVSGTLPNIPVNCITGVKGMPNALYIGMDVGVYRYDVATSDWVLFNEDLPNVEITELEIDFTENKLYAATYGRGLWSCDLFEPLPTCLPPQNLSVSDIQDTEIAVNWSAPSIAPSTGYHYAIVQGFGSPQSWQSTTSLFATFANLLPGNMYIVYVRSVCGSNYSNWISLGQIYTNPACSATVYDTGGSSGAYKNGEDLYWQICGPSDCYKMKIDFTAFDLETNWDALYIHNGDDISAPIFSSDSLATFAGFPAGGYTGNVLPGSFISTHSSGCLTLRFLSDQFVRNAGWQAQVTCIRRDPLVTNTSNAGMGTLRYAIDCIVSNDSVTVAPSIIGQQILLTDSTIQINKNVNIVQANTSSVYSVSANGFYPIFTINPGNSLNLKYVHLLPDSGLWGRAALNQGTLTLDNVHIIESGANLGLGSTIQNQGQMTIKGNTAIIRQ
ncbi:MAG: fibronectin type III domain-containing protein [Saprospiraceae bacterium]|nr:fibronectin type III domain-containing protein [Saprospiraceae bacterium]